MPGLPLDPHLFDQYVTVAREMMAELSKVVGDSYDPGVNAELTNAIHRVIAVSQSVLTMTQSLHAYHAPMMGMGDPNMTPAEAVTGIPPAEGPQGTPLEAATPPASV